MRLIKKNKINPLDQLIYYSIFTGKIIKNNKILEILEKKHYKRLEKELKGKEILKTTPIPIVEDISPELFYREYYLKLKPVVIKNGLRDWKAFEKWTPEFFKKKYGNVPMKVKEKQKTGAISGKTINMKEFVNSFDKEGNKNYSSFNPILSVIPELKKDINHNSMKPYGQLSKNERIWTKMFMGGANTITAFHMSSASNLFLQIYGKKKWIIITPQESPLVYVRKYLSERLPYFISDCKYESPKRLEEFPLTKYLNFQEVTLDKGDILWIPPFHWHWVKSETKSISLSNWWYDVNLMKKSSIFYTLISLKKILKMLKNPKIIENFDEEMMKKWKLLSPLIEKREENEKKH